jgi:hypothetical protein
MGCLCLTIAGGVFEIGGLIAVAWQIRRVQRNEFPERRGWVRKLLAWIRGVLAWVRRRLSWIPGLGERPRSATVHVGTAEATATAGGNLKLETHRGPQTTVEGRLARLELEMEDLRRKQREDFEDLERRLLEALRRADESEQEILQRMRDADEKRREALADSLSLEGLGTAAFFFGVVLSVLGNAVTC